MAKWSEIWNKHDLTRRQKELAVLAAADPARYHFIRPAVRQYQRPVVKVEPVKAVMPLQMVHPITAALATKPAPVVKIKGTIKLSKYQQKKEALRLAMKKEQS